MVAPVASDRRRRLLSLAQVMDTSIIKAVAGLRRESRPEQVA